MAANVGKGLDILTSVNALLREIEVEHVDDETGTAVDAREELVEALNLYHLSRYRLGKALCAYRVFLKEKGVWLKVVRIVGKAIDRDEKTILRIVEGYERASQLPVEAIEALEARGVDPAKSKNEAVVSNLLLMPADVVVADPAAAVEKVLSVVATRKAAKVAERAEAAPSGEPVSAHGVTTGDEIVSPRPEEKRRHAIKGAIRHALAKVRPDKQAALLIGAVEEYLYLHLGAREAITITPHAPAQPISKPEKPEAHALLSPLEMENAA